MPRRFTQYSDANPNVVEFECGIVYRQCKALIRNGRGPRCQRTTFRHPFCLQHCRQLLGLEVRPSGLPGAGCGLFAAVDFKPTSPRVRHPWAGSG